MSRIVIAACAFFGLAATAAAGPSTPSSTDLPSPFAAYFEVNGGENWGTEVGTQTGNPTSIHESWHDTQIVAAARGALTINTTTVLQFDVWNRTWRGHERDNCIGCGGIHEYDYGGWQTGYGGHLSFHTAPGTQWGVLASLGNSSYDDSPLANLGVEAAQDFSNWRLYGQAGYTFETSPGSVDAPPDVYGVVAATYYLNPDFAISGNLGFDRQANDEAAWNTFSWGARIEHKLHDAPISVFAFYEGHSPNGSQPDDVTWKETSQNIMGGLRFTFGKSTLRDLNEAVGLVDMNPLYGDIPR
jgi:hypothetical protein